MARHQSIRRKPKKRPNRYDPNRPDWHAVHSAMNVPSIFSLRAQPVMVGVFDAVWHAMFGKIAGKK